MTDEFNNEDPRFYMIEVYKKWHRRGFISVRYWPSVDKIQIEIAHIDPDSKSVESVSKCFINTVEFITYLYAEVHGLTTITYPDFHEKEFEVFGGSNKTPVISRVFRAGYWRTSKDAEPDPTKRSFRCTVSEGKIGANGSIHPTNNVQSFDYIQMLPKDIAHLYHSLIPYITAYTVQKADQVVVFDD